MSERIRLRVNGRDLEAEPGTSLLAALWNSGLRALRVSVAGEDRGALCAMGTCHECRVTIDGSAHRRACLETVRDGMEVETGE